MELAIIVEARASECVWNHNQRHVLKYMGLEERRGGGVEQESHLKMQTICEQGVELKQSQACGRPCWISLVARRGGFSSYS